MGIPLAKLRAGIHFASATLVKTVAGLIIIKLLAMKLGPDGFGQLGQLMTLVAITSMFAGGGVANGLIKALAKTPVTTTEGASWFSTAFTIATLFALLVAVGLSVFSGVLVDRLMLGGLAFLVGLLAISQTIVGYGSLAQSEASSRGETSFYAKANIIGTVIGLAVLFVAVSYFGFAGAAFSIVVMPSLVGLVALVLMFKRVDIFRHVKFSLEAHKAKWLLSFSMITLVGALSIPLAQIIIRDVMAQRLGWSQVGLWQGVVKLSDVYMQFVGVVLANYALPRCAAAKTDRASGAELANIMCWLLAMLTLGFFVLYFMKEMIIQLVFSDAFMGMSDYFIPQMIGDIFRTIAAGISFALMARGIVKISMVFELLQGIVLVLVFYALIDRFAGMAPVYAHLTTYGFLAVVMSVIYWLKFRRVVK